MNRMCLVLGISLISLFQHARADEFPDGALPLPASDVSSSFSGKAFSAKFREGRGRFDFRDGGQFYFTHSSGATDSGEWRVDDNKLCVKSRRLIDPFCSEARAKDDRIYVKRSAGDLVELAEVR